MAQKLLKALKWKIEPKKDTPDGASSVAFLATCKAKQFDWIWTMEEWCA